MEDRKDNKWIEYISLDEIVSSISIPGVVDTMALLGYDPIFIYKSKIEWEQNGLRTHSLR